MLTEHIISGNSKPIPELLPDVELRVFASAEYGARGISTGTARLLPGARLPYHRHDFSEAVTVLEGEASFAVEGRCYSLRPFDCIHVPCRIAHEVINTSKHERLVALWAFASATPSREMVQDLFPRSDRLVEEPQPSDPEHIVRFSKAPSYELAPGTEFHDLFAGRFGAVGICRGYGLSDCDTAFVPQGLPHRFLNESSGSMAMIWVYAGSEPMRTIVDVGYCTGSRQQEKTN